MAPFKSTLTRDFGKFLGVFESRKIGAVGAGGLLNALKDFPGEADPGQEIWTTPGTYTWIIPDNVRTICVVCIGAGGGGSTQSNPGGGGGAGGALCYRNDIPVIAGTAITVHVGYGGTAYASSTGDRGGDSIIMTVQGDVVTGAGGNGGTATTGGTGRTVDSGNGEVTYAGGNGGNRGGGGGGGGGGGAGGYSGTGGNGGTSGAGSSGNGGAGGGGQGQNGSSGFDGGGTLPFGEGTSGSGGSNNDGGKGSFISGTVFGSATTGKLPGGGGNGGVWGSTEDDGGNGVVRIIWGSGRSFPSTRTVDE